MRYPVILVFFFACLFVVVSAQAQTSAQDKAANLRVQLANIEAKQLELQTRLKDLDEQLKPENIASALAGVGSTHPEDLREQRRRQLEIERNGVQTQLNLLATSHTRLETSIAQADTDAYRQSAAPATAIPPTSTGASATGPSVDQTNDTTTPARRRRIRKKKVRKSKRTHHAETSRSVV
jgi:hypothetical protein